MITTKLRRFVITFNPSGLEKLKASEVHISARSLTFYEESAESAAVFLRLYVRNFCRVSLSSADFSVYEPNAGPASEFGLLSDRAQPESRPGMAGTHALEPA